MAHPDGLKKFGIKGPLIGVPLVVERDVVGVMIVWSNNRRRPLDQNHKRRLEQYPLLSMAASVIALFQAEAQRRSVLESLARTSENLRCRMVTADDLDAHADHLEDVLALHKALRAACAATRQLLEAHGVATPEELRRLGVRVPLDEVAATIARAHAKGELSDDELRRLSLEDVVDRVSLAA